MRQNKHFNVLMLAAVIVAVSASAWAIRLEVGTANVPQTVNNQTSFFSVSFDQTYDAPPVVVALATNQGSDPASYRINNVTTTGFDITIVEPPNEDGQHAAMNIPYLAIDEGRGFIAPGLLYEAGTVQTSARTVSGDVNFDTISFSQPFGSQPAVLTGIMTTNNEDNEDPGDPPPGGPSTPWMTTVTNSITASDFTLSLEGAETSPNANDVTEDETVGYVAFTQTGGSFRDNMGNIIDMDAFISANSIVGWDDDGPPGSGTFIPFNNAFSAPPVVVAALATRDGGDGGWLRRAAVSAGGVNLTLDEDQANDPERNHTTEAASVAAFSQEFSANITPEPISASMLAMGLAGLAMRRRRG